MLADIPEDVSSLEEARLPAASKGVAVGDLTARTVSHPEKQTVSIAGAYSAFQAAAPVKFSAEEDREPVWLQIVSGDGPVVLMEEEVEDSSVNSAAHEDTEDFWLAILDDEPLTLMEEEDSEAAVAATVPSTTSPSVPDYMMSQLAATEVKAGLHAALHVTDAAHVAHAAAGTGHSSSTAVDTSALLTAPIANPNHPPSTQSKLGNSSAVMSPGVPSETSGWFQSATTGVTVPGITLTSWPKLDTGPPAIATAANGNHPFSSAVQQEP